MTDVRFALITAMRRDGMTWAQIAREFQVRDAEGFAQTYRNEVNRRESAKYVAVLRRAGQIS